MPDANASGTGGGGFVAAATRHPPPRDTGMWLAGSVVVGWLGRSRFKNRKSKGRVLKVVAAMIQRSSFLVPLSR